MCPYTRVSAAWVTLSSFRRTQGSLLHCPGIGGAAEVAEGPDSTLILAVRVFGRPQDAQVTCATLFVWVYFVCVLRQVLVCFKGFRVRLTAVM